jgi:hypothetical protein
MRATPGIFPVVGTDEVTLVVVLSCGFIGVVLSLLAIGGTKCPRARGGSAAPLLNVRHDKAGNLTDA